MWIDSNNQKQVNLLMEYCSGGSLASLIQSRNSKSLFSEEVNIQLT